jgi:hypothetical protein
MKINGLPIGDWRLAIIPQLGIRFPRVDIPLIGNAAIGNAAIGNPVIGNAAIGNQTIDNLIFNLQSAIAN